MKLVVAVIVLPSGLVLEGVPGRLALNWLNYFIQNKEEYCDSVLVVPEMLHSFYYLDCEQGPPPPPPSKRWLFAQN